MVMIIKKSKSVKTSCVTCLGIMLFGLLMLVVVSGWIIKVVQKVFGGSGMEYCCSIWGFPFNYMAVFVLVSGTVFVMLFASILYYREWRLRKDFERKYGIKPEVSVRGPSGVSGSNSGSSFHGVDSGDGE